MILILSIVVGLVLLVVLVLNFYPVFGRKASPEKVQTFQQSTNFRDKKFVNQVPTQMGTDFKGTMSMLKEFVKGNPNRKPNSPIPMTAVETSTVPSPTQTKITWMGHSALLLEVGGKTLLLDPMFGDSPNPFPMLGIKRYSGTVPFQIEELPTIDAVVLSHDHYDHLDYNTIKKLQHKVKRFIVPLGVGSHLERWGVNPERISEHDWWSEVEYEGLQLICTPSRHFSGRSLTDRDATLWCSWVILCGSDRIYFSGDSGYGPHFQEIGEKYGPFDVTFMECGQYDQRWAAIHMMPEETVQAHVDVRGNLLIPIHWAAFTLGFHDWTDPIERATQAAKERNLAIATPQIGEPVVLGAADYPISTWWRD